MASQYLDLPLDTSGVSAGVDSFNGRTGVVVSQNGDYAASQITNTPSGNISATNVQDAMNELDTEKQVTITGAATTITTADLTINRAVISNGAGKIAVSVTTDAELAFVSGATSNLQTQLNAKEPSFSVLPIAKGGTNSGAALTGNKAVVTDGTAIIESTTTAAEIGFVSGATSNIQTQINGKQPLDATLTALAAYNTNGILTQTAADTFAGRTITGTAGAIAVTNGDGVAGNPTLNLVATGVSAGSFTNANLTVDANGRITTVTNGSATSADPNLFWEQGNEFTNSSTTTFLGLSEVNVGTASAASAQNTGIDPTEKAIGVFRVATGTTATGRAAIISDTTSAQFGYAAANYKLRVMIPDLGTVGDQSETTMGFIDDTSATQGHVDGAYFRFLRNGSNTVWEAVTSSNSVRTTTATTSTVLAGFFQIFTVIVNEAGTSATFQVDGVTVATHATNIPTTGRFFGRGIAHKKTVGTTNVFSYIDFERVQWSWSGGR